MYKEIYDSKDIRNKDYCVINYIKEYYKTNYVCLDLGCGNCRKIKQVINNVQYYYAIDNNPIRIIHAKQNCNEYYNIKLGIGDNFYLPFENDKFDLVSCFLTKYSVCEVSRVLKKGGIFIIETLGAGDKREIKLRFGKDQFGWRGNRLYDSTDVQLKRIEESMLPFFSIKNKHCIRFKTSIKAELLSDLFEMTNDIRCFDRIQDNDIIQSLTNDDGYIEFNEERLIIIGEKRQ